MTETGRQPWIATGILRTADAASPVSAGAVLTTLILFIVVYTVVFSMGIYYINRLIEKGPAGAAVERRRMAFHRGRCRPPKKPHTKPSRRRSKAMEETSFWLPLVWAGVLGVAVALYVMLDGFDLGIGILFPAKPGGSSIAT